jgi:hypothetical protein
MGDLKSSVDYLGHCCASKKSVCEELWLLWLAAVFGELPTARGRGL